MQVERVMDTPCGKVAVPEMFKEEYKAMSDEKLEELINARFIDPFALAERQARFLEKLKGGV